MRRIGPFLVWFGLLTVFCMTLTSCRLNPEKREAVASRAAQKGFEARQLDAGQFKLFVLFRGLEASRSLTVYVEGDGRAWRRNAGPPKDPTPKNPVALDLALADRSEAVLYIARPCQWLDAEELKSCSANYWANYRYAEEVINSVDEAVSWAISQTSLAGQNHRLGMVGYSGGGTVAALVSARRDDVDWLVSVSANLDHEAWTEAGGLTPLTQSLNPANFGKQLAGIPQLHLFGEQDDIVPHSVLESYALAIGGNNVTLERHENFDHSCCWADIWPARLESFVQGLQ
jgi:pimeloyl-ACP methyl ester carboxylesterase